MVQTYTIFGRKVGSHVLALATLGTVFGGAYLSMGGKKAADRSTGPPINAGSKDEEAFINQYITKHEADKAH